MTAGNIMKVLVIAIVVMCGALLLRASLAGDYRDERAAGAR